jgi:hypothetical protein
MAVKAAINGSRSRRFAAAPCLLVSILWLLSATVLGAELGGREPVLKQIALPHAYYYREMYVPQVTSGPGGAAWSPDGRELVVAIDRPSRPRPGRRQRCGRGRDRSGW